MLSKVIRTINLRITIDLSSGYHQSLKFKPRTSYDHSSGGYLSQEKWFQSRETEAIPRKDAIIPGAIIHDQPVQIKCGNLKINTWNKFSEIEGLDKRLLNSLNKMGHDDMTCIQKHTFDILNNKLIDLLGSAETGSGKTIAFLSPILNSILRSYPEAMMNELKNGNDRVVFPLLLVLAPTRELVEQIALETRKLLKLTHLRVCDVIGGVKPMQQMMNLEQGCHSIVATPGRLIDFMSRGLISLKYCQNLVLDEADRMLDMGFEPQVHQIVSEFDLPKESDRHTSMYSATFPDSVYSLAESLMRSNYGRVMVGRSAGSEEPCIPENINQRFVLSNEGSLFKDCFDYLQNNNKKTIIFCNKKMEIELLARFASKLNIRFAKLYGDLSQSMRTQELYAFKNNHVKVLISTAIAARGIDVADIECVINLGIPQQSDEYIHRIGRCGRMGRPGESMTFVLDSDLGSSVTKDIIKMMRSKKMEIPEFMLESLNRRVETQPFQYTRNYKNNYSNRTNYSSNRTNYSSYKTRYSPKRLNSPRWDNYSRDRDYADDDRYMR